jgi:hypothetical protein
VTRTYPASALNLRYEIAVTGAPISLSEFDARQGRAGVSAAPWGKRRLFAHTFMVGSLNDQVFMRTSHNRLPIRKLWGPSLPKELVKDEVANAFKRVVAEDGGRRVLHEIEGLFPKRTAS